MHAFLMFMSIIYSKRFILTSVYFFSLFTFSLSLLLLNSNNYMALLSLPLHLSEDPAQTQTPMKEVSSSLVFNGLLSLKVSSFSLFSTRTLF